MKSKLANSPALIIAVGLLVVCSVPSEAATSYSIAITPAPLAFGNVAVGISVGRTEAITNPGWKRVVLTGAIVSGTGFVLGHHPTFPYKLDPKTSVNLRVRFKPLSAGSFIGTLAVRYRYVSGGTWHWSSHTVKLYGTGTATLGFLSASPTTEQFGTVQVSTAKSLSETVTNTGNDAVTISQITTTGKGYSFSGIAPPVTLSAGQSASFKVTFTPQTSGSITGKLTLASNASDSTLAVALSGTGSVPGQIAVSPSSVNFGSVVEGTSKTQAASVAAVNGPLTVSAANVSGSEFSISGISFPFTLSSGQSKSYSLVFAPSASGATSATVTWLSSATNSPVSQSLSGTGTIPPAHSVTLNWQASTSNNIVGYNVYRGTQSGGPYTQINSALDTTTTDIDYTVTAGQIYYYVVTAVNSSSQESGYSNQVKAAVPYP